MQAEEKKFRNGYPHMVTDYYVERVREKRAERRERLQKIKNRSQAEEYREYVESIIKKTFSPMPPETPLNARVTGVLERAGYRIEKVIFESRPGCMVTGNLYVPEKPGRQLPAVLGTCGHSNIGKEEDAYQHFCQRLVKSGFAVFIYDPVNQGERDQYQGMAEDLPVRRSCAQAHNMLGGQMSLVGEWFGTWRLWDGVRALDYLLSRPEVDRTRIGITGNSGGGTMTTWLWSMDGRFSMAAPSCFVSTFISNLENDNYADIEQCPPGVIGKGLEHADFFIARAPKPVILLGQKYDFFDRRGLKEAYSEIKRFYGFFNAEKNVKLFIGKHSHGYHPDNQKKMVEFFSATAGTGKIFKGNRLFTEKRENLWATGKGSVIEAGSVPIYRLVEKKAERLAEERKKASGGAIKRELRKILDLPAERGKVPYYRILRPAKAARYAIETEEGIRVFLRKTFAGGKVEGKNLWTLDVEKSVNLYLPHVSSELDMGNEPLVEEAAGKKALYALDVRGTGESAVLDVSPSSPATGDKFAFSYGHMLGESYTGRQVYDVLQTLRLLRAEGADKINLYGKGYGAVRALFAALIDGDINKLVLKNVPVSFHSFTCIPVVEWAFSFFPPGILEKFDIPDCIGAMGKKVKIIEPATGGKPPL